MEKLEQKTKKRTLEHTISFRVSEKNYRLIEEAKKKIDDEISLSSFLRFLVKESIHFDWTSKSIKN